MRENNSIFEAFLGRLAAARVVILFLFHAVVFAAAYAFSYLLRFEFAITVHPQIVITDTPQPDAARVRKWIAEIQQQRLDARGAIEALHTLIPEFQDSGLHTATDPMSRELDSPGEASLLHHRLAT
jgi:hypothetical protein